MLFLPLIALPIANVMLSGISSKIFKYSYDKKYESKLKRLKCEYNDLESDLVFEGRKNKLIQQKIKQLEAPPIQEQQCPHPTTPIETEDEQLIEI